VAGIHAAPPLLDYVQALLTFSRQSGRFRGGLSPRAGLALLRAARAWALLHRRDHVLPEDVQVVLPAVVGHRLHPGDETLEQSSTDLVGQLLDGVALPA
jgi:MoxR-like ATPase